MLTSIKSRLFFLTVLAVTGTLLSSFTSPAGGEGFEIYLDNKVVMQRYGNEINTVQELNLTPQQAKSKLTVRYHHCGKVGRDRVLRVMDEKNNVLKEWRFNDVSTAAAGMACNVSDILDLSKTRAKTLKLHYTSSELPKGRFLAVVNFGTSKT